MTDIVHAAVAPMSVEPVANDGVVLAGRRLRPGTDMAGLSVFADDVWDLNPCVFRRNSDGVRLDFSRVAPAFRQTAKEAVFARLQHRCGPFKPADPHTAASLYWALTQLPQILAACGAERLGDLDPEALDDWLTTALATQARSRVRNIVDAFRFLSLAESHLSGDQLEFIPWGGRGWYQVAALPGREENRTPRLPEAVFRPLIRHALLYIHHFADDILAASNEHAAKPASRCVPADDLVEEFIARRRSEGRAIPGSQHRTGPLQPAWRRVAALSGLPYSTIAGQPRLRRMIEKAAQELGLDETDTFHLLPGPHPETGRPWRAPLGPTDLLHERRMLLTACYAVIAFLSGMRDSEVYSLRRGCATRLGQRGEHMVWRIRGTTYKGEDGPGTEEEWVVLQAVVDAVHVLERLTDGEHLLTKTSHNQGREQVHNMNRLLRSFIGHLNVHHDAAIPDWPITTRQFRRTVAWYIANRPFGVVAGMIQFKHVRTSTFLGYAGTSPSGFVAEIESERHLGQAADILERYEDWKLGAVATGPAARRLAVEFARIRTELGDFPGQVVDRRRLERLLAGTARTLHVGPLNDCLFDREKARCLTVSGQPDAPGPVPTFCQPGRCPNSRIDHHHLIAWREQQQAAVVWLGTKRLAPAQRECLEASRAEAACIISAVEESGP